MVVVYVVVVKGGVCSLCGCQLLKLLFIYVVLRLVVVNIGSCLWVG